MTDNNNGFYNNSVAHIQNNSGVAITYYGVSYAQGASIPPSSARGDIVLAGEPYDFSVVNTDGTYTDFADRLHLLQTSAVIDKGYDPDYAGMPFFTTALGHAADIPPVDIGYHYPGVVRYVDAGQILAAGEQTGQSWTTAYKYLQDALDEAVVTPITSICVAKGTYYPDEDKDNGHVNNDRTESFNLVEGMELYGGFFGDENPFSFSLISRDFDANQTILSGDINNPWRSYHVLRGADHSLIDGLRVQSGDADGSDSNGYGGGVIIENGSTAFRNCWFYQNFANYGGAIYSNNATLSFDHCLIVTNSSSTTGIGGILYCTQSDINFTNCTLAKNNAFGKCGGIYAVNNSSISVINSIFWQNEDVLSKYGFKLESYSTVSASYSDIPSTYYSDDGTGVLSRFNCIDEDPLFANTTANNFHVISMVGYWNNGQWQTGGSMSPCIDMANPDSNFTNEPSPNGNRLNLGYYGNTAHASKSLLCVNEDAKMLASDGIATTCFGYSVGYRWGLCHCGFFVFLS